VRLQKISHNSNFSMQDHLQKAAPAELAPAAARMRCRTTRTARPCATSLSLANFSTSPTAGGSSDSDRHGSACGAKLGAFA
jgi:hypothetical protein